MKKIIILLLTVISFSAKSQQPIDTVYVRNLSLKYEEHLFLKSQWTANDSATKKFWKKWRTAVAAVSNPSNSTQIVIDSVPGRIALQFYSIYRNNTEGQTAKIGSGIKTKIFAYTPMVIFATIVDAFFDDQFTNNKKNAKDDFDN